MRLVTATFLLVLPVLMGCKLIPPADGLSSPVAAGATTAPDGAEAPSAAEDQAEATAKPVIAIRPKPRPGTMQDQGLVAETPAPAEVEPATPPLEKSEEQISCEKRGGEWQSIGSDAARTCVKRTRDGGKQCRKESDCDGVCLARSRTCAPVKPLFGCNEILQNDGRRVTLCID